MSGSAGTSAPSGAESGGTVRPALPVGEFVPLAALLMSLVALAIDTMLPAPGVIGQHLGVACRNDAIVTTVWGSTT